MHTSIITKPLVLGLRKERLRRLLEKELFREFLIKNGIRTVLIDDNSYTERPDSVGCFFQKGVWTVYETDERSKRMEEARFERAEQAFQAIAEKFSRSYQPSVDISRLMKLQNNKDAVELETLVQTAIEHLKTISQALVNTKAQGPINEDIIFLHEQLQILRERRFETTIGIIMSQNAQIMEKNAQIMEQKVTGVELRHSAAALSLLENRKRSARKARRSELRSIAARPSK